MNTVNPVANSDGLYKLTGVIQNLKVKKEEASFVFTEADHAKMGAIAIAASLAGLGGQATGMVAGASAMEEQADYLQFDLDGTPVKGWVWRNPFRNGDAVEVAAEKRENHFECFAVAGSKDQVIALYPHCSRGNIAHYMNAVWWWFFGWGGSLLLIMGLLLLITLPMGIGVLEYLDSAKFAFPVVWLFLAFVTWQLSLKWLPFVRLAERVFRTLEFPDPSNVDLVKRTKARRKPSDPGELGAFYFYY
jgi:hypothetical protein